MQLQRKQLLLLALLFITSAPQAHTDGGIVVKDAWIREAPPVAKVLAAYMKIENHTGEAKVLRSISSAAFSKVEIHKTIHKDGMASMEKQEKISIPAQGQINLGPGKTHLMLFHPTQPLRAGDSVSFLLTYADGSKTIIGAVVKKATAKDHHHVDHQHHGKDQDDHAEPHRHHKDKIRGEKPENKRIEQHNH